MNDKTNRTPHAAKRFALFVILITLLVWSFGRIDRAISCFAILLLFFLAPHHIHRLAVKRIIQKHGFRLNAFGHRDEARKLIGGSAPVVVAYRHPRHPSGYQAHELWKETGSLEPDSLQTVSKTIRPGTLLFVILAEEQIPLPVNSTRLEP